MRDGPTLTQLFQSLLGLLGLLLSGGDAGLEQETEPSQKMSGDGQGITQVFLRQAHQVAVGLGVVCHGWVNYPDFFR